MDGIALATAIIGSGGLGAVLSKLIDIAVQSRKSRVAASTTAAQRTAEDIRLLIDEHKERAALAEERAAAHLAAYDEERAQRIRQGEEIAQLRAQLVSMEAEIKSLRTRIEALGGGTND